MALADHPSDFGRGFLLLSDWERLLSGDAFARPLGHGRATAWRLHELCRASCADPSD